MNIYKVIIHEIETIICRIMLENHIIYYNVIILKNKLIQVNDKQILFQIILKYPKGF